MRVEVRLDLKMVPEVLSVGAVFGIYYNLKGPVSDDDARAFCLHNAIFNVWPYWRELVQDQSMRMGTQPVVVPLLKR